MEMFLMLVVAITLFLGLMAGLHVLVSRLHAAGRLPMTESAAPMPLPAPRRMAPARQRKAPAMPLPLPPYKGASSAPRPAPASAPRPAPASAPRPAPASAPLPSWLADSPPVPVAQPSAPVVTEGWTTVAELAGADNVLLVGNRGSGKTTLLQAILKACGAQMVVFDPHEHPRKWPAHAQVLGGGRGFSAILQGMRSLYALMDARSKRYQQGVLDFTPVKMVGDEWGSVTFNCDMLKKSPLRAGVMLGLMLKEGRKFKIQFIGAAHGDTAASLGSAGDTEAFENNFDALVYLGSFAVERIQKHFPKVFPTIRYERTPEGGEFPLTVIVWSTNRREWKLLSLDGLRELPALQGAAPTALDALLRAEGSPPPEQPEPTDATAAQEEEGLSSEHLRVAYLVAQAQPRIKALVNEGRRIDLAVKDVLSHRKLAAALYPDRAPSGDSVQAAGRLLADVERLLGLNLSEPLDETILRDLIAQFERTVPELA